MLLDTQGMDRKNESGSFCISTGVIGYKKTSLQAVVLARRLAHYAVW